MKPHKFLSSFCLLCLLMLGTFPTSIARSSDKEAPIKWWVNIYAQNSKWLEVTVKIREGKCVSPDLKFYVDYIDSNGAKRRLESVFRFKGDKACSETGRLYYQLELPAKSVGEARMIWQQSLKRPRPIKPAK